MIRHLDVVVSGEPHIITPQQVQSRLRNRERCIEWEPNIWDPEFVRESHHSSKNFRCDVCMLVRIEMCDVDSRFDDLFNLGSQFAIGIQAPRGDCRNRVAQLLREKPSRHQRTSLDQHQVAADIKCWSLSGKSHRIIERIAIRHERRRSQHPVPMGVYNPGVHIAGEPKIVRVDNQLFQLKDVQLDTQILLWISAEGLQYFL